MIITVQIQMTQLNWNNNLSIFSLAIFSYNTNRSNANIDYCAVLAILLFDNTGPQTYNHHCPNPDDRIVLE